MHKSATKCYKTLSNWCKNKHGASKIIDMFESYQAVLCFANSLRPLGHPVFGIYEGVRESWTRGSARGPNKQAPRGLGIWPHGPCPLGPRTPPHVPPVLRLLLLIKNGCSIFPDFISFENSQKLDFAKNIVRFCSFIQVWDDSRENY
jgi:hypothetical protein